MKSQNIEDLIYTDRHGRISHGMEALSVMVREEAFGTAPTEAVSWLHDNPVHWHEGLLHVTQNIDATLSSIGSRLSVRLPTDEFVALKEQRAKAVYLKTKVAARMRLAKQTVKSQNVAASQGEMRAKWYELRAAVLAHREATNADYDPSDADLALWAALDALETA